MRLPPCLAHCVTCWRVPSAHAPLPRCVRFCSRCGRISRPRAVTSVDQAAAEDAQSTAPDDVAAADAAWELLQPADPRGSGGNGHPQVAPPHVLRFVPASWTAAASPASPHDEQGEGAVPWYDAEDMGPWHRGSALDAPSTSFTVQLFANTPWLHLRPRVRAADAWWSFRAAWQAAWDAADMSAAAEAVNDIDGTPAPYGDWACAEGIVMTRALPSCPPGGRAMRALGVLLRLAIFAAMEEAAAIVT